MWWWFNADQTLHPHFRRLDRAPNSRRAMTRAKMIFSEVVPQRFFHACQHAQGDRHTYAQGPVFIPDVFLACSKDGLADGEPWRRLEWRAMGRASTSAPQCVAVAVMP